VRVYGPQEQLLGLAEIDEHGALNPRRLMATEPKAAAAAAAD